MTLLTTGPVVASFIQYGRHQLWKGECFYGVYCYGLIVCSIVPVYVRLTQLSYGKS